ncbi:acyltransferase 3, partial [Chaetomium strumarium]
HLRSFLLRTGLFLLPSFLHHPRLSQTTTTTTASTGTGTGAGPTAYLDGMRGLAALFVFFCHHAYTAFAIAPGYGYRGGAEHRDLLKLPFLRLFFSGPPMVCVFFVVSGYALSLKPLRLIIIHTQNGKNKGNGRGKLMDTMASLTFRRAVRLFLPPAVSTLMVVGMVRLGLYEWTREFAYDARYVRNHQEHHYGPRTETLGEQVGDWARQLLGFVHVWDWAPFGGSMALDVHLWTIPVEFRCSMALFLTIVGTARLRRAVRLAVVAGLVWFSYWNQRWEMVLFYAGMVLAEADVVRGAHGGGGGDDFPVVSASRCCSPTPGLLSARRFTATRSLWWIAVSIVGLYFMSQPDEGGAETPGWVYLTKLIPKWWGDEHRYWQSFGAVIFVLAVGRSACWQRFFNLAVVQYLGRISYAVYLMHGPVLHTVGYALERWAWGLTGTEGRAYVAGFLLASVFVVPIVIWVSDVFWRAVDAPVVRFAKWLEKRCSISE